MIYFILVIINLQKCIRELKQKYYSKRNIIVINSECYAI